MSTERKQNSEKASEKDSKQKKTKLDKELESTFPASDPPSHTRPGHDRDKDGDK
jgi:hypothetical protein